MKELCSDTMFTKFTPYRQSFEKSKGTRLISDFYIVRQDSYILTYYIGNGIRFK